jgi:ribosome assembly protein YihI (activator of Der GTPase)
VTKKRKPPVRHKVKSYTRQGKRVNSYVRGKGEKKTNHFSSKRKIVKKPWYIPKNVSLQEAKDVLISEEELLEAEDPEMKEELIEDIKNSKTWTELENTFSEIGVDDFPELLRGAGII